MMLFLQNYLQLYRHANFSLANEFYNIAVENNIDWKE